MRSIFAPLVAILFFANSALAQQFEFELINGGAVIANTSNSNSDNTGFPSVVRLPDWLDAADRAHPSARYYMYWGNHTGDFIRMKWAASLNGTWTDYDVNAGAIKGVFDVGGNDPMRNDYDHVSAPDVIIDDANQRFVMYFHGQREASNPAPRVHERFVATSGTGLNFNDPVSGNGESGHGPVEVTDLTNEGLTRDVWIGDEYMKVFQKNGRFYGVGKRGAINAAPASGDIWAQPSDDPFGEAWDLEDTPESNWASYTSGPSGAQDEYYSPGASFLASQEFEDHPNNPVGRRIYSNQGDERLNHVDVNLLSSDALEVFFYIRKALNSSPDEFSAIYRFVYDISDSNFQNWTMARDASGQVIFDVVLRPEVITAAVTAAQGPNFDEEFYADPESLGDSEILIDDDGSTYLFFSYVSLEHGGRRGEGQISGVRLIRPTPAESFVTLEAEDFTSVTDSNNNGETWQIVADSSAHGGQAIRAPSGLRINFPSDSHDTIATYRVTFSQPGTYTAYYRSYGTSGVTNSFYSPTDFEVEPLINHTTARDGEYAWVTGAQFAVTSSDVGNPQEFGIGRREKRNRVDAIVFHTSADLSDQELDALFDPSTFLIDRNEDGAVNIDDIAPAVLTRIGSINTQGSQMYLPKRGDRED